jgi:hypothetical protein
MHPLGLRAFIRFSARSTHSLSEVPLPKRGRSDGIRFMAPTGRVFGRADLASACSSACLSACSLASSPVCLASPAVPLPPPQRLDMSKIRETRW